MTNDIKTTDDGKRKRMIRMCENERPMRKRSRYDLPIEFLLMSVTTTQLWIIEYIKDDVDFVSLSNIWVDLSIFFSVYLTHTIYDVDSYHESAAEMLCSLQVDLGDLVKSTDFPSLSILTLMYEGIIFLISLFLVIVHGRNSFSFIPTRCQNCLLYQFVFALYNFVFFSVRIRSFELVVLYVYPLVICVSSLCLVHASTLPHNTCTRNAIRSK